MKPRVIKSVSNTQELVKHTSTNMSEILVYINQGNLSQSELWCYWYLSGTSFSIFVLMISSKLFITGLNDSSPLTIITGWNLCTLSDAFSSNISKNVAKRVTV